MGNRVRFGFLLVLSCMAACHGCGGSSPKSAIVSRTGKATFTVKWPTRTARLIPAAANSIRVIVLRKGVQVSTQLLVRPLPGSGNNTTTATFDPLPVDTLTVSASAFPNADGTGVSQASGATTINVQSGANTTVSLTMDSTIDHIVVGPDPAVIAFATPDNNNVTVTATALDKDGNVVLTAAPFAWSTDNPRIAATGVSTGAMITVFGTGIGATAIHVTETEAKKSGQSRVIVRGTGLLVGAWPKFRSDARNTGSSALVLPLLGAQITLANLNGPVESSPVVALDGTIYSGSSDGNVYAFTAAGAAKWKTSMGGNIKATVALGSDGIVYAASANGHVIALDPADGSTRWDVSFVDSFTSSPTIGPDGTLFLGSINGVLYALDGSTGEVKWADSGLGAIDSSPALSPDGSRLYIGAGSKLCSVQTKDGAKLWGVGNGSAVHSSPAVSSDGSVIYCGRDDGSVVAVKSADGSDFWPMPAALGAAVTASPALANLNGSNWVLVGATNGKFCALDAQTGAAAQGEAFFAGGAIRSSAAVSSDGSILVGADDGILYGLHLDPSAGLLNNFLSTKAAGAILSSPAIASAGSAGDVVYYSSTDGSLISIGGAP